MKWSRALVFVWMGVPRTRIGNHWSTASLLNKSATPVIHTSSNPTHSCRGVTSRVKSTLGLKARRAPQWSLGGHSVFSKEEQPPRTLFLLRRTPPLVDDLQKGGPEQNLCMGYRVPTLSEIIVQELSLGWHLFKRYTFVFKGSLMVPQKLIFLPKHFTFYFLGTNMYPWGTNVDHLGANVYFLKRGLYFYFWQ